MLWPALLELLVLLVLAVLAGLAAAFSCSSLGHNLRKSWKHDTAESGRADSYSAGVVLNPVFVTKAQEDARLFDSEEDVARLQALPKFFDARKAWKHCPSISKIVDQGCCGSCWAYASALAMTDRQCIQTHEHFEYSAKQLLHCSKTSHQVPGCVGGDPADAFKYWTSRGVVSTSCLPYSMPPLDPFCRPALMAVPDRCVEECRPSFPDTFDADLHYGERYLLLPDNRSTVVQAEILYGGPVVATLDLYEDFKCYKQGIYEHVAGKRIGAHAARLIGWGTDGDVPYWLGANSWGTAWGEGGFFRIRRAVDECRIESMRLIAGYPSGSDAQRAQHTLLPPLL